MAKAADQPFCERCYNTGVYHQDGLRCSGCFCDTCEAGKQARIDDFEEKKREQQELERRREEAKQAGVCPKCFGGSMSCCGCGGSGKYYIGPTGDLKLDCRMALYAEGMMFSADAIKQAEVVSLEGNDLVVRGPKTLVFSLRDRGVERVLRQVVGKLVHVRVEVQGDKPRVPIVRPVPQLEETTEEEDFPIDLFDADGLRDEYGIPEL